MSDIVHDPQCHFISKACISLYGCCHECRVVSCRVVSCRVVSCRVDSCHVVSCRVVSCRVMHVFSKRWS